ncbi:unnamed protein product [Arabidopsis thaliana]|uniref:Uncharacterized protein n=1 Tax=Arabidopsis thaliana TaxID=3702 RepID=Q9FHZ6_ARATH|nr:unnamed protein product [Arabidopsis thaliana]
MGSDRDGAPPENTKREVEDRDIRRKSSREKPSGSGKDSGEEKDVSRRRESKRRTKDGNDSGSESGLESGSESEKEERRRSRKDRGKRKSDRKSSRSRRRRRDYSSSSSDSESESESEYSDSEESESEDERRRRKRKRKEREEEEKERKRRRREKDKKKRNKSDKDGDKKRKEKKKKKSEKVKKGAVTESWGKYGIIRETDMWNKRPEFTACFMEDHNTGTFTSKNCESKIKFSCRYYDIDGYYRLKLEKEMKKGLKKAGISERTVFNDEEQRRLEMQELRERQKEEEVLALKRSMEGGMAQAMKEQARLKEEMVYLYKIGDMEVGAAAIQRRLDPDVPM